ncbi:hypothetical protein ACQP25_28850 [Microtetraspora malaysiensis]|uniref:hypothetical protein n=1 Tax=Microtetraspora malaysiensis TaxID=161358 RepID=UPI003D92CCC8
MSIVLAVRLAVTVKARWPELALFLELLCTFQVDCRETIRFENEGAGDVQPLPDRQAAAVLAASIHTPLRFLTVSQLTMSRAGQEGRSIR